LLVLTAESFERITRVAAQALRAPLVMISIRDDTRPHFEAVAGLPALCGDELRVRQARALCRHVFDTGQTPEGEYDTSLHGTGALLGVPLRNAEGKPLGALCAIDDPSRIWSEEDHALLADIVALFENEIGLSSEIQRRRAAEETSDLITRELAHRIKNIFTVIASLVTLSGRGHPEARDFAKDVGDRIAALGRANDYVRPHAVSAAPNAPSLIGLIEALMAPYQEGDGARIAITGQDAPVGRTSMTTLALVLHELATNAVKYGALSTPAGRVLIRCEEVGDRFSLTWQEQGGPPISGPPTQQGFGTILSGRAAATQLGADIAHDWRAEGLVLKMTIPLSRLAI
jgi:two-component sensor histidine kinase